MNTLISVIIPCYNSAHTIGICLHSVFQSEYPYYEVIVVNDGSNDDFSAAVKGYTCRVINLPANHGAGYARNIGAKVARGDILFFTDADCVLQKNTLSVAAKTFQAYQVPACNIPGHESPVYEPVAVGGTYSVTPFDENFYSRFQSVFIHYAETKHCENPDYIATHALAIPADLFRRYSGFNNDRLPILEDVEYSHRLRKNGVKLTINSEIQVQHIFNFSLKRSMVNAVRKTRFWIAYSLGNHDLLADSGTASHELKFNTLAFLSQLYLLVAFVLTANTDYIAGLLSLLLINIIVNVRFLRLMIQSQGVIFTLQACAYYMFVYPLGIIMGSLLGLMDYIKLYKNRPRQKMDTPKEAV